jgi:hypothetical protein
MSTLEATMKCIIDGRLSNALDLGDVNFSLTSKTYSKKFTQGTGADQANQIWTDTRTIVASGNDDLDLAGGLVNAIGVTLTLTSVKGLFIFAYAANTNNVIVGDEGTNPFASMFGAADGTVILPPGSWLSLMNPNANGYAVTATTGDKLRITNGGGTTSVTYDIVIIGETA